MRIKTKFELGQEVFAVNPPIHFVGGSSNAFTKPDHRKWEIREIQISGHGNSDLDGIPCDIFYQVSDGMELVIFQEGELVATLQEWWENQLARKKNELDEIKGIIEDLKKGK